MKNFKLFLSVVFVLLLFNSCENEEDLFVEESNTGLSARIQNESVISVPIITFGRYYGKCQGVTCVEIFKLVDFTLLKDRLDRYPTSGSFYQGKFVGFKGSNQIITSDILSSFPLELLDSKSIIYGTPDAGDWGGIYLEYEDGNHHRYWFLDLKVENNPKNLRAYVALIDKKITLIGEINNLN